MSTFIRLFSDKATLSARMTQSVKAEVGEPSPSHYVVPGERHGYNDTIKDYEFDISSLSKIEPVEEKSVQLIIVLLFWLRLQSDRNQNSRLKVWCSMWTSMRMATAVAHAL
jgi:hypothetical protein